MNDNVFTSLGEFLKNPTVNVAFDNASIVKLSVAILLSVVLGILIGNIIAKQTY